MLSFLGLVLLSWLFVILSIAVVIDDPGPVFFTQKRVGKNKSFFKLHKFRSMKMSTPHDTPTHLLSDPEQYITRVGKILRKTKAGPHAQTTVSVSNFPPGVYLVKVNSITYKITKRNNALRYRREIHSHINKHFRECRYNRCKHKYYDTSYNYKYNDRIHHCTLNLSFDMTILFKLCRHTLETYFHLTR